MPVAASYTGTAPTLGEARSALLAAARVMGRGGDAVVTPARHRASAPELSVVVLMDEHTRRPVATARAAMDDVPDVELVVLDAGLPPHLGLELAAAFLTDHRVTILRADRDRTRGAGALFNLGGHLTEAPLVVTVDSGLEPQAGWLPPLQEAMSASVLGSQPVVVNDRSGLDAAGLVVDDAHDAPVAYLRGHPTADAALVENVPLRAVGGGAVAVRRADFTAVGGFVESLDGLRMEADLCGRIGEGRSGHFVVASRSRVLRRTAASGVATSTPLSSSLPVWGQHTGAGRGGARRWGIKIASTPGTWGDAWGDTYFAEALAAAIAESDDHAVLYRRGLHDAPGSEADDILLGIRGLEPVRPRHGAVNVLWIISHPESVTAEELEGFDLVYAASSAWATAASGSLGREVRPLLQATDTRFSPQKDTPLGPGRPAVFVGSALNRRRPVVHAAIKADAPVAVYGPGWRGKIPRRYLAGERLEYAALQRTYRRYGLVLADQWEAMSAAGFVSNRLFDAVAAGVPVISGPVPDVDRLFSGAVQTYRRDEELHELLAGGGGRRFPGPEELSTIAARVAKEHSFQARVQVIRRDLGSLDR